MTTQQEFDLLLYVLNARSGDEAALANHCGPDAFTQALRKGLISYSYARSAFVVTEKGNDLLDALQEQADQEAKEDAARRDQYIAQRADADQDRKKQFRHDWWITIVGSLFSFTLGAIADHFFDVVAYCSDLWSSLISLFH